MPTLGIARDEQRATVARRGTQGGWQARARRSEDVHHLARLLYRIQVGVIAKRRDIVARIVGRDDNKALCGESCGNQAALAVGRIRDVCDVRGLVELGAMRIQDNGTWTGACRGSARRHHQRTGGFGRLTGAADGPEGQIVEIHAAGGVAGQLQQLRAGRRRRELSLEPCGVQRGDAKRRILRQRAGGRRRCGRRSLRT